jgi:hypothetical protein
MRVILTILVWTKGNVSFSPAIDGTLIPRPVAETVRARGKNNVPILGGGCRHEGTLFPTALGFKPDGSEFDEAQARNMFAAAGIDPQRALDVYEQFAPNSTAHQKLVHSLTDTMFRNSMVRILRDCNGGYSVSMLVTKQHPLAFIMRFFWTLFALSSVIFIIQYVATRLAFVKTREKDLAHPKYPADSGLVRSPGSTTLVKALPYLCAAILVIAIILFDYAFLSFPV